MSPLARIFALPVRAYRLLLSPWVGHGCRFQPTCSAYALEALEKHGAFRGSWLALRRILRCHPWGGEGYDPVPGCGHGQHYHSEKHDSDERA
ncbi:MAG TPA: membrane protein insertion efficiency factor YidD [Paracoccus sp. (in: a-proteobacteria)]|uniref:membrane protein insertion efficiency factor YidD n=1 Tax=uncultured Paracoccus sp. TaxID=189685 RepID=UPI00261AE6D0|nr:membrane protein insertion efficiency factor YidD [uncultured Paracoccus sp.]HMQ42402.1 membrane protein insertion efficiency factor YidD [Paracoccus sp. (in: a-proteobacteria)]HMR35923.1 membrane protein insertion efficiency factor YidD [Paracoccus sp. (in: a-proteobacteria)]